MGAWHFWFFLQENPHAYKIPPFRGGFWFFLEGGGSANFVSMGVEIFSELTSINRRESAINPEIASINVC